MALKNNVNNMRKGCFVLTASLLYLDRTRNMEMKFTPTIPAPIDKATISTLVCAGTEMRLNGLVKFSPCAAKIDPFFCELLLTTDFSGLPFHLHLKTGHCHCCDNHQECTLQWPSFPLHLSWRW